MPKLLGIREEYYFLNALLKFRELNQAIPLILKDKKDKLLKKGSKLEEKSLNSYELKNQERIKMMMWRWKQLRSLRMMILSVVFTKVMNEKFIN